MLNAKTQIPSQILNTNVKKIRFWILIIDLSFEF